MPRLIMRAVVSIESGAELLYDCPLRGGDYQSEQFFSNYRGKKAVFVRYGEKLLGPLDFKGRAPGRYLDSSSVVVRFVGEDVERELNILHFVLVHPREHEVVALHSKEDLDSQCLGNLHHPILFYPGDCVLEKALDLPRVVRSVFLEKPFTMDLPRYDVAELDDQYAARMKVVKAEWEQKPAEERPFFHQLNNRASWNRTSEDLELISRGNVYHLYHDHSKLVFPSEAEEAEFWAQTGVSYPVSGGDYTLGNALRLFRAGKADCFSVQRLGRSSYYPARLLDCWEPHRSRVRALTERLYQAEFAGEAA